MPWEGMPAFIWLTDGVHHWMNSVVIHRSFWVLGREARNMCWNYDFQWYKRTLWEIIILLQDLSYQERAQTFLAEGEWSLVKGKVKWGAFSSIQSSALTNSCSLNEPTGRKCESKLQKRWVPEPERSWLNRKFSPLIFQAWRRCREVCVFRTKGISANSPSCVWKSHLFFRLNELPVTAPTSLLTLVVM